MTDEVLVEHDNGLVIITINRPHVRNAVNRAVSYGVCEAIDEMERRPDLRVAILTGAGGNFCAGMDLKAFSQGEITRVEGRGILGIASTPPKKPLIAAVEGYALAGGFEAVLACDQTMVQPEGAMLEQGSRRFGNRRPEIRLMLVLGENRTLQKRDFFVQHRVIRGNRQVA